MDRRTRNLFLAVLGAIIILAGGVALFSGNVNQDHQPVGPDAQSVTGVIVAIDSSGLADVRGFTLRLDGGSTMDFLLDRLQSSTTFPPGHFAEHQATAEPVKVWYEGEMGVNYAIRVDDAPR